jgi:chromosome segregation ATPase
VASLNFLERNALVNALRDGKSWPEAVKALPVALHKAAGLEETWRKWAEAEAKKPDAAVNTPVKLDPEEFLRLRAEVEALKAKLRNENADLKDSLVEAQVRSERLNADLAEMRRKDEDANKQIVALTHERDNLAGEVRKLQKDIESLVLDDKPKKK